MHRLRRLPDAGRTRHRRGGEDMSGDMMNRAGVCCRARITKDEAIRYISHLDYASLMQRAIRRAKLPAAYSEGFNPHMKMSFASALSVGVTSDAEYMDVELSETLPETEIAKRLRSALPDGVRLLNLRVLDGKPKALMALTDEAVYEVTAPLRGSIGDAREALDGFNAAAECSYLRRTPKKTREIEVRQYMVGDVRGEETTDGRIKLTMAIRITPGGSVKPQEILTLLCEKFAFPVEAQAASVCRRALLSRGKALLPEAEVKT